MQTLSTALAAHLAGEVTTLAVCWRVTRKDGVLILGTQCDKDIVISVGDLSGTYVMQAGITGSAVRSTSDMSVDNVDVEGAVNTGDLSLVDLSASDIEAGLFDDASVKLFLVNWESPDDGQLVLREGTIGEISRTSEGQYRTELRGLAQRLTQNIIRSYSPTCDAELGDLRCGVGLQLAGLVFSGTVDSVIDRRRFSVSLTTSPTGLDTEAEANEFFVGGLVSWTSGANDSFSAEVKQAILSGANTTVETITAGSSWTCPDGVYEVAVECWGGGGGGGTGQASTDGGGGGGGGAYAKSVVTVVPGASYSLSIGAAGAGAVFGASVATDGGDTSWDGGVILAKGGSRGKDSSEHGGTGGHGGVGGLFASSVGTVRWPGGTGERGNDSGTGRGGFGGSSAGTGAAGFSGSGSSAYTTSTYPTGSTPTGAGHGGDGGDNPGVAGSAPSSGYGGGGGGSGENANGGPGTQGKIVLTYGLGVDITLFLAMPKDVVVGDSFTIQPGCDKSAASCKGKFNNLVNFRGHGAWVPGVSELMTFGGQTGERKPRPASFLAWPRVEP